LLGIGTDVRDIMKNYLLLLSCILFITVLLETEVSCSVLKDPGVPDGEQIVWRITKEKDDGILFGTITWHIKDRDGKPVYEIIEDGGERKQAKYIIDKSDLRLIWAHVIREGKDGRSEATIEVTGDRQCLVHNHNNKSKDKKIDHEPDGYNGMVLGFCLRGFPFESQTEVDLKLTPPFRPEIPLWAWKMWKSYVKLLGEEKVTVPAGTFDCYKLEVAASGGLIRRFTSEYYFWFTKEPPHRFVKYQDDDGKAITELMEICSTGTE
jgi:hypothetical protein